MAAPAGAPRAPAPPRAPPPPAARRGAPSPQVPLASAARQAAPCPHAAPRRACAGQRGPGRPGGWGQCMPARRSRLQAPARHMSPT
eukprot:4905529-Prymnesium_polylepis.1